MVCASVRRDNPRALARSFSEGIIDCTGAQSMLYLTCTMISSVDLAHYGLSRAKDWLSVDCGTISNTINGDYCIVIFRFKNILLI